MSILEEIVNHKKMEVADSLNHQSAAQLEAQAEGITVQNDFKEALRAPSNSGVRLIAEIKHKSPSRGNLNLDFNPQLLAKIYAENGASAISVLTDKKYFGGSLDILKSVKAMNLGVPLLRKDFIFDRYQILEARAAGASAVLLIVAILDHHQLEDLIFECQQLSLTPLVEVHDESELELALSADAEVIGINNRNLHDFSVNLETSLRLAELCPPETIKVAESGINSVEDLQKLAAAKIDAVLVGEALVTALDIASKVRSLTNMTQEYEN
ncbi:MAG: indole-3-glycerol phosphate synthase TrpC [Anaerolineales bacterium]